MLYDKSNVLYGINHAKVSVRKQNQCVLTEGYTDAIMCHQAGFENTVAVSGTALTPRHLNLLKRYSDNLLLAFDMDLAGDNATKRGINLAESSGFSLKIIDTYSGAKDPAEIILENPDNWKLSIEKARSIMDYYFDSAFSKFNKALPTGKKEIGKIILPAIKRLQNKIEQAHWANSLAEKLGVKEEAVLAELSAVKIEPGSDNISRPLAGAKDFSTVGRKKLLEEKIVSLISKDPANLDLVKECHYDLFSEGLKILIENIKKSGSYATFSNSPAAQEYKDFLNTIALMAEVEFLEDGPNEIQLCLAQLKDIRVREKRTGIAEKIKTAESAGDDGKVGDLIKEFNLIN